MTSRAGVFGQVFLYLIAGVFVLGALATAILLGYMLWLVVLEKYERRKAK